MPEYELYCFAQSGNCYRAALMLNLIGADWKPVWVDFFAKGEQRTPEYLARFLPEDIERWAKPIRAAGISVD